MPKTIPNLGNLTYEIKRKWAHTPIYERTRSTTGVEETIARMNEDGEPMYDKQGHAILDMRFYLDACGEGRYQLIGWETL